MEKIPVIRISWMVWKILVLGAGIRIYCLDALSPKENKGWNILKIFSEEILEFTVDVHVKVLK